MPQTPHPQLERPVVQRLLLRRTHWQELLVKLVEHCPLVKLPREPVDCEFSDHPRLVVDDWANWRSHLPRDVDLRWLACQQIVRRYQRPLALRDPMRDQLLAARLETVCHMQPKRTCHQRWELPQYLVRHMAQQQQEHQEPSQLWWDASLSHTCCARQDHRLRDLHHRPERLASPSSRWPFWAWLLLLAVERSQPAQLVPACLDRQKGLD